ncbi:glutaminase [Muriicola soli]|uniref:glutaminase n=1 Tax=Muriicola soli TaxID=2507538 RepID=A0A411E7W0_9FLAO|nr:hypothetical protein EQY75_04130 [Muriicola soli]
MIDFQAIIEGISNNLQAVEDRGIAALLPNKFCVVTWSPGLNPKGNSKLCMLALEQLTSKTGLSIF